jgi:hypothetical protein
VKKTRVIYLVLLAILSVGVQAQQLITGTVKDNKNEPLIGASIVFKNTTTGTTADQDGNFSIQIDSGIKSDILMVSFIGYITQEVNVGEKRSFDIVLLEDTKLLGEVVVMGYAVQERGKLTGAVNIVGEDLISKLPVPSIDQALQGRAPGVVVTQNTGAPGEGVAVDVAISRKPSLFRSPTA